MADVAAIRQKLAGLSPEQRAELDDILKGQLTQKRATPGAGELYRPEPTNIFTDSAIAGMGAPSASSLGEAGENLATAAGVMAAPGMIAGPAGALMGAARQGLGPAAGAVGNLAVRGAVGAGAGALVGSLPFVGSSPMEGAKLGALIAAGQGGTGALWKHGKRKKMIEWLINKATGSGGVVEKGATTAVRNIPAEVEAAKTAARVGKAVGSKGKTTMATNLGGKAKPGPPGTPPDEIEAALRASLKKPPTTTIPGGTAGSWSPEEVASQIGTWRTKQKFSDPQILSALRNVYGIPSEIGKQLLQQF